MKTHIQNLLVAVMFLSTLNSTLHAQGTAFTYQGRVMDNGTNFNGSGQFQFALVTSTNANQTATATALSGGYVTGYNITHAGNGYTGTTVPLTITDGGSSGASAHGNITGGAVTSITVDNPGNGGYNSAPTVTIAAPPAAITYTTYWSNDGTSVSGSGPALRVMVDGGSSSAGALSVSANGTGPIAVFGNSGSFVASVENDGTIKSKGLALTSDRNAKENFTALNEQTVLAKVLALPVTEWNYKDDAADKKHISVVDEGGVALAAIQGLNQKLEEQQAENKELKQQLSDLKQLVQTLVDKK